MRNLQDTHDSGLDALLAKIRGGLGGHEKTGAIEDLVVIAYERGRLAERRAVAEQARAATWPYGEPAQIRHVADVATR